MLLGNYLHQNRNTVREVGIAITNPLAQFKYSNIAAFYTGEPTNNTSYSSFPNGTRPPESWHLAPKAGGLSATQYVDWTVTDATLQEGREISGATTITFTVPGADLLLTAQLVGAGTITFTVPGADLGAAVGISGDITFSFTAGPATLGADAGITGTATFTLTGGTSTLTGIGELSGDITPYTTLSPENLAIAVWTRAIEAGFTAEEMLRIIAAHAAGAATGLEGANPQFTGIDGTTLRIDGTYSSGTRTIDALDGS